MHLIRIFKREDFKISKKEIENLYKISLYIFSLLDEENKIFSIIKYVIVRLLNQCHDTSDVIVDPWHDVAIAGLATIRMILGS